MHSNGSLAITNAQTTDEGTYNCIAFNPLLNVTRSSAGAQLYTLGALRSVSAHLSECISFVSPESLMKHAHPESLMSPCIKMYIFSFDASISLILIVPPTVSPSSLSIAIGSTVTFSCSAASPVSQLYWYNFNNSLVANNSHTSSVGGLLTIVNASLEDEGYYTCTAVNYKGAVSTTALLDIQGREPMKVKFPICWRVYIIIETALSKNIRYLHFSGIMFLLQKWIPSYTECIHLTEYAQTHKCLPMAYIIALALLKLLLPLHHYLLPELATVNYCVVICFLSSSSHAIHKQHLLDDGCWVLHHSPLQCPAGIESHLRMVFSGVKGQHRDLAEWSALHSQCVSESRWHLHLPGQQPTWICTGICHTDSAR